MTRPTSLQRDSQSRYVPKLCDTCVFVFSIDSVFETTIEYWPDRFHVYCFSNIPLDIVLFGNNIWMLHKMVNVRIMIHKFEKLWDVIKVIFEGLVNNTNCTFEMETLKDVTELFGRRFVGINVQKGISLSVRNYEIRQKFRWSKRKEAYLCAQVTKLRIEANNILSNDTFDLFPNLIELEIWQNQLFDFNSEDQTAKIEPRFSLSKFAKLKHLSLVFNKVSIPGRYKTSAIHIPKQIQTLKMDGIYSNDDNGLQFPIVIEDDSVLHTLEINCSYSTTKEKIEVYNFIEILNLCNKLNHFQCLKINMKLSADKYGPLRYEFCRELQYSRNRNKINQWKHNEQRTIIVTFTFPVDNDWLYRL